MEDDMTAGHACWNGKFHYNELNAISFEYVRIHWKIRIDL